MINYILEPDDSQRVCVHDKKFLTFPDVIKWGIHKSKLSKDYFVPQCANAHIERVCFKNWMACKVGTAEQCWAEFTCHWRQLLIKNNWDSENRIVWILFSSIKYLEWKKIDLI